jgi:STE24 endopeptidase
VRDWSIAAGLSWLAIAVMALGGWTLARRLPRLWAPVAAFGAAGLTVVLAVIAPVVLEPLFLRTRPLEPGPVRDEVERVLERADVETDRILVADASRRTTKENAYVSGLGATRHVVLYDTLLAGRTPPEVGLVLAHELGHVRHADVARGVLLAGAGAVAGTYGLALLMGWRARRGCQDGPADPRAAAVVMAAVVLASVVVMPLERAVSRRAEAAADLAALELTQDPATYMDAQVGIARASLSDPAPPAWVNVLWLTHPPPLARLAMGLQWPADGPAEPNGAEADQAEAGREAAA